MPITLTLYEKCKRIIIIRLISFIYCNSKWPNKKVQTELCTLYHNTLGLSLKVKGTNTLTDLLKLHKFEKNRCIFVCPKQKPFCTKSIKMWNVAFQSGRMQCRHCSDYKSVVSFHVTYACRSMHARLLDCFIIFIIPYFWGGSTLKYAILHFKSNPSSNGFNPEYRAVTWFWPENIEIFIYI